MHIKQFSTPIISFAFVIFLSLLFVLNMKPFLKLVMETKRELTLSNAREKFIELENNIKDKVKYKNELADINGIVYLLLNKLVIGNFEFIKDKNNIMQQTMGVSDFNKFYHNMLKLKDLVSITDTKLLYACVPSRFSKGDLPVSEEFFFIDQFFPEIIDFLEKNGIDYINGNTITDKTALKTDIHLSTKTEFNLADAIAKKLLSFNIPFDTYNTVFDINNWDIISMPFLGNLSRSSGRFFIHGIDNFDVYFPKFSSDFELIVPQNGLHKTGDFKNTLLNGYTELKSKNEYTYWVTNYLQFPNVFYTITNKQSNNTRLLFIMDSFTLRTITFIAAGVGHISVFDPRMEGFTDLFFQEINNHSYDSIIVSCLPSSFSYPSLFGE